jgi:hypothetical protein
MNAAEITDKLGLHSLRQRAWVREIRDLIKQANADTGYYSTSNRLALHPVMVSTKDSNG